MLIYSTTACNISNFQSQALKSFNNGYLQPQYQSFYHGCSQPHDQTLILLVSCPYDAWIILWYFM